MKLVHLSDLHIGKRVNEYSMCEDQKFILAKILKIIEDERPDGVIIAGDIYDKSFASADAVAILDDFLYKLSKMKLRVFAISGNHDSPERVAYGGRVMQANDIYLSPVFNGVIEELSFEDKYGSYSVYLLPFVKPSSVRRYFPDKEINNYTDSLKVIVDSMNVDTNRRNILVCHQFVTGATRSDSEEVSVGGLDNVEAEVFDAFDYVALGHIHSPQRVKRDSIRYCGTPLKYSFSEAKDEKSVTIVEIKSKGDVQVSTIPLEPMRDMREIKGTFAQLTDREFVESQNVEDYLHVTLTDEEDVPNARGILDKVYKNIMKLDYDNTRTRSMGYDGESADVEKKDKIELFDELYEMQNGTKMNGVQKEYVEALMREIWGE